MFQQHEPYSSRQYYSKYRLKITNTSRSIKLGIYRLFVENITTYGTELHVINAKHALYIQTV